MFPASQAAAGTLLMKIVSKMGVTEQDCDSRLIEQVTLTTNTVHDHHVLKKLIPTETKAV